MKTESKNKVIVRGKVFGGPDNLACIPMVPAKKEDLIEEVKLVASMQPDIIEWRIDYFEGADNPEYVKETLEEMAPIIGDIPVIFTLRHVAEGGAKEYSNEVRLATIKAALSTGHADLVDVEAFNDKEFIDAVREAVHAAGSKLILSHHNFKATPDEQFIINKLLEEQELGADIAKLAVMPQSFDDVLTLMRATYRARTQAGVDTPMITMSMGELGKISRVITDMYGSDMSFVVGKAGSAPGQIPVDVVKNLWSMLK